ncbi:MAG: HAD family hydrolase [Fimbriimonadaceae bacterium]|nr:HAD family hydrolase [Fimbriimonadaceae bacterium]
MPRPIYQFALFDFDGTLVEYRGNYRALAMRLRTAMGDPGDPDTFAAVLRQACIAPHGPRQHVVSTDTAVRFVATHFGRHDLPISDLADDFIRDYVAEVAPIEGMKALLADLRSAGTRIAIVSNGPNTMQRAAISQTGYEFAVDAILVSGDVQVAAWKPDPRIFERALARLRSVAVDSDAVRALIDSVPTSVPGHARFVSELSDTGDDPEFGHGAVMIGDSVAADLHGARAIGLHAIGFRLAADADWTGPRAADAEALRPLLLRGNPASGKVSG